MTQYTSLFRAPPHGVEPSTVDDQFDAFEEQGQSRVDPTEVWERRVASLPRAPVVVTCRYCGVAGLSWVRLAEVWRLHDARGTLHTCEAYRASHPLGRPVCMDPETPAGSS